MKITIKKTTYSLILPLLMANATIVAMDLALTTTAYKTQQAHKIINEKIEPRTLKAHFTGKITMNGGPLGYGCPHCIDTLKKRNINTQQNWPLAPVLFSIQVPKDSPQEEQKYFNITEAVPSMAIEHAIQNNLQKEMARREQNILALLEGESDQLKNEILCNLADTNDAIMVYIKNIINDLDPVPGLLPAHLLHSSHPIVLKGLFAGSCDIIFTFNEHQQLATLTKKFQETPTVYTLLTPQELNAIDVILENLDSDSELELDSVEIIIDLKEIYSKAANKRNEQLKKLGIITQRRGVDRSLNLLPGDLLVSSENYEHGTNGIPNIQKLVLEKTFNGKNPATFATKRQTIGNQRRIYHLKK